VTDGLGPEVEQPNISMNQMLVNLDIVVGEGNPGAIALRHLGAEGSAIEDCTIDATGGLAGILGGIGSGVQCGRDSHRRTRGADFTGHSARSRHPITGFTLQARLRPRSAARAAKRWWRRVSRSSPTVRVTIQVGSSGANQAS
jgi:hypothetical protein